MKKISLLSLIIALMIFTNCGSDDSVTINPVDLNFSDSDLTVDESAGTQTITVSLGDVAPIEGTFTITLGGTATYGTDYSTTPAAEDGVITISVEEGDESKELTVELVDDTELELDETITLSIASDIETLELGANSTATVTLTSNDQALVAVERSSGKMYMVNLEDGSKTDLLTITGVESSGGEFLRMEESNVNIRSFVYDPSSEKGYIGQNNQGGSKIYSVDMSSGAATVLYGNDKEEYDVAGITDLHIMNSVLYGSGRYFDNAEEQSAFGYFRVKKNSDGLNNFESIINNPEFIGGGAFLLDDESAYMTQILMNYGELARQQEVEGSALIKMALSDNEITETAWTTDNISAFTDAFESFTIADVYVQNFASSDNGDVYAVIYHEGEGERAAMQETEVWMLAKVDLENAKLSYVSTLTTDGSLQVQAAGFLPEEVVLLLLSE
ncbi:Calx-beta domain-containing protein [Ekhidna sp.]|uniref:Calx-beta domain-containing protein n=1 Tax=Ekhidna sp. TaxID=2608089 RepID=UPI003B5A0771